MESAEPSNPDPVQVFLESTGLLVHGDLIRDVVSQREAADPSFANAIQRIGSDARLSQRLIHLANSAWFGSHVPVESVEGALERLGAERFCGLCIVSVARQALHEVSDTVWPHLEFTAEFCEILSERIAPDLMADAYWVGLFHDYLVPFMVKGLPDYRYWVEDALATDGEIVTNEHECYAFSHAEAAAALVRAWGFAPRVAEAVGAHHRQGALAGGLSPDGARMASLLVIAERIAQSGRQSGGLPAGLELESGILAETVEILGLKRAEMKEHIAEMCALVAVRAFK